MLAPCCQAEVASVLRQHKNRALSKGPLAEIYRHPIHTREFGSQLTNVLRCLQLEAHGYQLTVTELVGWEHSMKNELIIASNTGKKGSRPQQIAREHWATYGRNYYTRHDYEDLDTPTAKALTQSVADKLPSLAGQTLAGRRVALADDFSYTDPVDGSVSKNQGLRIAHILVSEALKPRVAACTKTPAT